MSEESLNASVTSPAGLAAEGGDAAARRDRRQAEIVKPLDQPLLLRRDRVQAMVEIGGTIPRQHLLEIRLQRAFALPHLLGPPFLGRLAVFGSNLVGIDEGLRAGGSGHGECDGGDDNELFQMSLLKRLILALGRRGLKRQVRRDDRQRGLSAQGR
jgi:hypothetical protein